MKKVIGLFLVVLLSSVSVFARDYDRRGGKDRRADPQKRMERIISDLKLDEKQAAEYRKIQKEHAEKAQKEREAMRAERQKKMLAMRDDKNARMKKVLTDEQYKLYLEKQTAKGDRQKGDRQRREKGRR